MSYEVQFQHEGDQYKVIGPDIDGVLALIQGLQDTEVVPEYETRRDAAEATLKRLKYEWRGGDQWMPPIDPKPAFLDDIRPGWVEWSGGHRPVRGHAKVEVEFRSGAKDGPTPAHRYEWGHGGSFSDIVMYRVCE